MSEQNLNPHDYGIQNNAGQTNYDALSQTHNALLLGRNRIRAVIERPSSEHPLHFPHASSAIYLDPKKIRTQPAKSAPEAPKTGQNNATTAPRPPNERPCFSKSVGNSAFSSSRRSKTIQGPSKVAPRQPKISPRRPHDTPREPQKSPSCQSRTHTEPLRDF